MIYYAGIGSRQTPKEVLDVMTNIASYLEKNNWILRSGGAIGADSAFEKGVSEPEHKEIFYANDISTNKYGNADIALKLVDAFHPAPSKLSQYARYLMARNSYQVLGTDLVLKNNTLEFSSPSDLIICWTKDGKEIGGTSQAMRIAKYAGIPIINLGNSKTLEITTNSLRDNTLNEYLLDLIK